MDLEYKKPCLYVLEVNQHRSLSLSSSSHRIPIHSASKTWQLACLGTLRIRFPRSKEAEWNTTQPPLPLRVHQTRKSCSRERKWALTFISTDSIFLDPNQYFPSELFSLGMIPTADALEAYCGYGDLVEYSFEPHIATATAPITEGHLHHSMDPLERLQPNGGLSFSTNGEIFPRENPTVTVQQVASGNTNNAPSEEEQLNLARQRRKLRNRETA
jgi:hypothetical protein